MRNLMNIKLFVLMTALLLGVQMATAYDFEEAGIYYNVNDDGTTLTVTKDTESPYFGDVVIPDEVTHDGITYSVTAIADLAFYECTELTGIVIGDSVSSIGRVAFGQCTNLTNVTVGLSVPSLRVKIQNKIFNAFAGCKNITSLTWRARNCTDLGGMVTANFQQVTLGDQVEVIPNFFAQGSQITEITIPNSVTTIGNSAFDGCSSLSGTLSIPNSVTSIGEAAFSGCIGLTGELTIPNSVTAIRNATFNGCSGLSGTLTIPNSVSAIGSQAFADCVGITAFNMGNAITSIGNEAFLNCLGITEISIPNSVVQIGIAAFEGCENLGKVNISSLEAWCGIDFNISIGSDFAVYPIGSSNPLFLAHHLYLDGQEIMDLVIPNSIADIKNYAFIGGSGFTSLTFGDAVTTIGESAFKDCTGLTSVTLGGAITSTGYDAFSGCSALTSLTLGKSVTQFGLGFEFCPNLTSLAVESGNPVYDSRDGCNAIIHTATNALLVGCQTTVIPNTVTRIEPNAFYGCEGLTSIVIPKSVTSIGVVSLVYNNDTTIYYYYNPFIFCSGLKSITVESGNPVYDSRDNCNAIIETATNSLRVGCQTTVIPNSVSCIEDYAFEGCSNLTTIEIPNSVSAINNEAFCLCTGLTNVIIPSSVTSIGDYAFSGCQSLTGIDIPNSVKSIGGYAFMNCTRLTSVVIPDSLIITEAYKAAFWFQGCTGLIRVTIGSGMGSMGGMFWKCPNILRITCLKTTPPKWEIYQYVQTHELIFNFDNVVYSLATLYVPAGALDTYKTATYWQNFQDIRPLGDFDRDGDLGISDVSSLIDYLLTEDANGMDLGAADADGNGKVEIADLSVLIDMLLSQ
ncbi:MAG: leucine-rich repeat protein [Muribaculaceae bacterium]|nr:leucine-rich repeat protein [Muribaculaceae bacterium]